jgi:hypothetical protein
MTRRRVAYADPPYPGQAATRYGGREVNIECAPDCGHGWREVDGKPGGAKPAAFTRWLLDLLDWKPGDEFVDVFPGSGGVDRAVRAQQLELEI